MDLKKFHFAAALLAAAVFTLSARNVVAQPATMPATAPAEAGGVIQVTDKAALDANKDKDVSIEGTCSEAAWSNSGKVLNVNFEGGRDSKFGAVVFVKSREKIDAAFGGDATKAWTGAKLRIKGKLVEYGGKSEAMKGTLQIIISDPSQVTVVDLPTTQPAQ